MDWSKAQKKSHEESFDMFRQKYLDGELRNKSISEIQGDKNRCVALIHKVSSLPIWNLRREIQKNLHGFYHQEIPHFTIDCHRYLRGDEIQGKVISDEELAEHGRVLGEIIGNEAPYDVEINGIAIGGDGLIAQVWFDEERLIDFTRRLGEKVRKEIPSMDFEWGFVKSKVPKRIMNLTRFTGGEDRAKVVAYADNNRVREIDKFSMDVANLVLSDHYIQKKNTKDLGGYFFKD